MSINPEGITKSRFSPGLIVGIMLTLFFALSLFIRVYFPYARIFVRDGLRYAANDVYYHMRLVDIMVHNFPHLSTFDPYMVFPGGASVGGYHLFHWLLASIIWLVGLGTPTEHTIDMVGIYFPTVLGALMVIPVYFVGKELFGRWAGVLSAALITIIPGEFLARSILGFTDQDIFNTLLTTLAVLFLILAVKAANERQFTFDHLKRWDWAVSAKPIVYSLLTGVALGLYMLAWAGGLLFAFIIAVYFVFQFIIDHLKQKPTAYLCLAGVITFLVTLVMVLPTSPENLQLVSLVIGMVFPLVLGGISWLMARRQLKPFYYPLTLVVLGLSGLGILYLVNSSLFNSMRDAFSIFIPTIAGRTTIEMQSLFTSVNGNPFWLAWGNLTTSFFIIWAFLIALIIYALFRWRKLWHVIREAGADKTIFVVWSLVILLTVIGQRRFVAYLAINVVLLTGYLSWQALRLVGFKKSGAGITRTARGTSGKKTRPERGGFRITVRQVNMTLAALIVFLVVFAPNVLFPTPTKSPSISTARAVQYAPSNAWVSSLKWLRENTPDPFGNPDAYYQLEISGKYNSLSDLLKEFPDPADPTFYYHWERSYPYPESAYGVMAWWDYGYWITRIAHRIPNANPGQDPRAVKDVAAFFLSQDEASASAKMEELGSRYVAIDYETSLGKFYAIATWAGISQAVYFEQYLVPQAQANTFKGQVFLHPEYYRSMASRLYNFDGKEVIPESTRVISYEERAGNDGNKYKIVTSDETFNSYEEAEAYLAQHKEGNYRIVGTDPLASPVPLEALDKYQLVHGSEESVALTATNMMPAVKIFEYTGFVPRYK